MFGFASQVRRTLTDIPRLDGQTITIRKLGWKALEAAATERQRVGLAMLREIGPGGLIKELQGQGGEDAVRQAAAADPFVRYDPMTLLERGIVEWSLSGKPTSAEIEDLDLGVAEYVAREVYALSRPKTEDERKNG